MKRGRGRGFHRQARDWRRAGPWGRRAWIGFSGGGRGWSWGASWVASAEKLEKSRTVCRPEHRDAPDGAGRAVKGRLRSWSVLRSRRHSQPGTTVLVRSARGGERGSRSSSQGPRLKGAAPLRPHLDLLIAWNSYSWPFHRPDSRLLPATWIRHGHPRRRRALGSTGRHPSRRRTREKPDTCLAGPHSCASLTVVRDAP